MIRPLLTAAVLFLLFSGTASAAKLDAPWTGTGPGTTKLVGNGVSADPRFDYSVNAFDGAWTYSAVAGSTREVAVAYDSSGFYSFYQVTTKLVAFVSRGGADVATKVLAQEGPVDCCSAPSGGFSYKGTTTFDVKAGDVYGFRVSGSNYTGGPVMTGSLKLQELDATAPAVTPVVTGTQVTGDYYTGPVEVRWGIVEDDSRVVAKAGCDDVTVPDDDADRVLTCTASSRGGETTRTVTIKRGVVVPPPAAPAVVVVPGAATPPTAAPAPSGPAAAKPIDAVLAFRFTISKRTTRLIQLRVKNLPKGASVTITCKGASCPKKLRGAGSTLKSKGSTLSLSALVKANLAGGTTINIAISASGAVTTIKSLAVRKGKAPVVNTCTASGAKPVAC